MFVIIRSKTLGEVRLSSGFYIGFAILALLGMALMVSQLAVFTYDILVSAMFPAIRHFPAWCYVDQWSALYRFCGFVLLFPAVLTVIYRTGDALGLCERVVIVERD